VRLTAAGAGTAAFLLLRSSVPAGVVVVGTLGILVGVWVTDLQI
jgi:hypothetical protein